MRGANGSPRSSTTTTWSMRRTTSASARAGCPRSCAGWAIRARRKRWCRRPIGPSAGASMPSSAIWARRGRQCSAISFLAVAPRPQTLPLRLRSLRDLPEWRHDGGAQPQTLPLRLRSLRDSSMRIEDLRGKKIGGLVSGGLDSCTITHWLRRQGAEPHCYTVDLGQPDEPDLESVRRRMLACGAVSAHILPGQAPLAEAGLKVIQAQARYEGGYWNTTAIARYVTTRLAVEALKRDGITILFHGATGRGNDQVRFQLATNMLAPEMEVYAPWRDPKMLDTFGGR